MEHYGNGKQVIRNSHNKVHLMLSTSFKRSNNFTQLASHDFLAELFGPVRKIERQLLKTTGYSGSAHEKITLQLESAETIFLILKHISPSQDFTVWRTGNINNREATLLDDKGMADVWDFFQPPYIAYAIEDNRSALLMHDVSKHLFPDVREPILPEQEDIILRKLAQMHAHYWQHRLLSKSWLAKQDIFFSFLCPHAPAEEQGAGRKHPIFEIVQNGWKLALQWLPSDIAEFILNPPVEKLTKGLPKTLIHGDSKLANFAMMPDSKVCAFDWAIAASASPACEIGWFISVNASRLARPKEEVMNRYRGFLQRELNFNIENQTWERMVDVAILTGVEILLWNKALNLQKNLPGANEEWNWWANHIKRIYEKN
jgi:hypothetical protein